MENQQLQYIPGTCNIGPEEIKRRVFAGWVFLAITIVLIAGFYFLHLPHLTYLILFFPAAISAMGFLQASFHFCVAYGTKGLFNVSYEAGKTESVSQQEFRKKDQQKSIVIIVYSVIIGLVVAVLGTIV